MTSLYTHARYLCSHVTKVSERKLGRKTNAQYFCSANHFAGTSALDNKVPSDGTLEGGRFVVVFIIPLIYSKR